MLSPLSVCLLTRGAEEAEEASGDSEISIRELTYHCPLPDPVVVHLYAGPSRDTPILSLDLISISLSPESLRIAVNPNTNTKVNSWE